MRSSYQTAGFSDIFGIGYRIIFYIIALLMGYAVISITIWIFKKQLDKFDNNDDLLYNTYLGMCHSNFFEIV